jgi:hypothetical protein
MIHSSRRERKTKAIAGPGRETDERLWEESASEFSAALNKYCAEHMPGPNKQKRMV